MNAAEAQALLTVAAAFDNRKPDADSARAWAAALDGLPFADCRDAIVKHYRGSSEWLMPGHVIAAVKQVRAKRIADAGHRLVPPPGLTEPQERAWIGEARRRVADGEAVEDVSPPRIGTARRLELTGPATVQSADVARAAREAHAEAKRVLQEAAAERNAERDRKRAAREEARRADREARANADQEPA